MRACGTCDITSITMVGSEMEEDACEPGQNESASNAGWADVMQMILKANKPKGKKTIVLAKARKLCDVRVKEKEDDVSFEIDGVKEEDEDEEEEDEEEETHAEEASIEAEKHTVRSTPRTRERCLGIRVKPSITDRDRERLLQKIATKYN